MSMPPDAAKARDASEVEYDRLAAIIVRVSDHPHYPAEAPFRIGPLLRAGVPESEAVWQALDGYGHPA